MHFWQNIQLYARFDSIARRLTADLNTVITDYETLESLAEIILENGINEPNFRYIYVYFRLYTYVSEVRKNAHQNKQAPRVL